MKQKLYLLLTFIAAATILTGCATTGNDYFGYNNHPKYEDDWGKASDKEDSGIDVGEYDWENPLGSDYDNRDNFTVNYDYNNMPPTYIPVVVPWYAGFGSWYNSPFSGFYFGFGYAPYPVYDWYSPFYSHCPYYYSPHIYYAGNRWWDWNPSNDAFADASSKRKKTYTIRNFGPQRGTYSSSGEPYAGGSSSGSGRTRGRTVKKTSDDVPFDKDVTNKRIKYKPVNSGVSSSSGFGNSRSPKRSSRPKYNKHETTRSPVGNTSGLGSGGKSSLGGSSSGGGSKSSGGSTRSSGGSKSSSPRSSGRGK